MAHTDAPSRHNGYAIRDFRVAAKLSVDELANLLLISAPHLRNIENEHRAPTPILLRKIAEKVGCRPASLVRDPAALAAEDRAA